VRPKERTISRHYKRRRAEERREQLVDQMAVARKKGRDAYQVWLAANALPTWTTKVEVKPARLRFHYRLVVLDR
jgi:hypothetical protein